MPRTILIVDDDPTLVHALGQFFEKEGYRALTSLDGVDALKQVEAQRPDLIILDIQMPRLHGYSFLFELRKIDGGQDIPVVVLTSFADMGGMFQAEGVKEYLVKPCAPQALLEKVRKYI